MYITIGAPGAGKSTWIKEHGLELYTVSPDNIRLEFASPELDAHGDLWISQENDKMVWEHVFRLIEHKMQEGETIFVDATHSRPTLINRYRKLATKYRYRLKAIDFRIDPDVVVENNEKRRGTYKYVPKEAVLNILSRLEYMSIPSWVQVIRPNEFDKELDMLFDFNKYERINIIGDIHSCFDELMELKNRMHIDFDDPSQFTVFLGDLFDRGEQPVEVFKFVEGILQSKNVMFLNGNHEQHLMHYEEYYSLRSKLNDAPTPEDEEEYNKTIRKKIPVNTRRTFFKFFEAGVTPKRVAALYRRLAQMAYISFGDKKLFINHAGYPIAPTLFTKTRDLIHGIGEYDEIYDIAETWQKKTEYDMFQICGHRDPAKERKVNSRFFIVNGDAEFDGHLRGLQIYKNTEPIYYEVRLGNYEGKVSEMRAYYLNSIAEKSENIELEGKDLVDAFRGNEFIEVKDLPNGVHAVNFTRKAFEKKVWTNMTTHARGLFLDDEGKVVARGYNKFFNLNEIEANHASKLHLQNYPCKVTKKENGFLGILSHHNGDFFIASKTSTTGDYAVHFRNMIEGSLTKDSLEFLQDNDVSLLFEVVDPVFDPHIEPYDRKVLYLLDAVKNKMEFEKHPRVNTMEFLDTIRGSHVPIEMVEEIDTVNSFNELKKYLDPKQELLSPLGIEGFVFSFGDEWKPYMIKTKTEWYKFWKWARTLKEKMYRIIKKKGGLSKGDIAQLSLKLHSYEQHEVFKFFLENQEMLQQDIISLRNKMLHNKITQ